MLGDRDRDRDRGSKGFVKVVETKADKIECIRSI